MARSDDSYKTYMAEAREILASLEGTLLDLEQNPQDEELIAKTFRALHTIKGSGAMFGFDTVSNFAHEVENVFDLIRNGRMEATHELIGLTLKATDLISRLLQVGAKEDNPEQAETDAIVLALKALCPEEIVLAPCRDKSRADQPPEQAGEPPQDENELNTTYHITFRPSPKIYHMGINPSCILDDIKELGENIILANTDGIPVIDDIDPELNYISWSIILTTRAGINAIRDNFIFVEEGADLSIEVLLEGEAALDTGDFRKLAAIIADRGDLSKEDLSDILDEKREAYGAIALDERISPAALDQQPSDTAQKSSTDSGLTSAIRVPSEKLDILMDLVGELVTIEARITRKTVDWGDFDLVSDHTETLEKLSEDNFKVLSEMYNIANDLERITGRMRDCAVSIRMMPIGLLFGKFRRLVRDLSLELGREVKLETEGAETELDKTVMEKIGDPLMHLIRNSIGHGIEPPDDRILAGKPAQGTIKLSAFHSGAYVHIQINDDGQGLDAGAIMEKAVERGLVPGGAEIPEKDIFELIMLPGFSTTHEITEVSGRGVGMDVVRRRVEALRGSVSIESAKGNGTTITLKIPLTLAIIEGLLVKVAGSLYLLPISDVSECIELTAQDKAMAHGKNTVQLRDMMIPYIKLREVFDLKGEMPEIEHVVITHVNDTPVGFAVDAIVEKYQTVIKSLGAFYRNVDGISGATILGDGTVALILDVDRLCNKCIADEENALNERS